MSAKQFYAFNVSVTNISVCGRSKEIDCRAKGRFWLFGFSKLINEIDFSSEALTITVHLFFSFLSYHLNMHGFF